MSQPASVVHALIDLSRCSAATAALEIERLQQPDVLGSLVARVLVISTADLALPAGWRSESAADTACDRAFFDAAAAGAHLVALVDGARPSSEALSVLVELLGADPLFGFAHPRFADPDGRRVACPRSIPSLNPETVAREVLATVPDFYVTTEYLSPCFVIRRELVGNIAPTLEGWTDARGILADYATRGRRIGFRTVISNRSVVRLTSGVDSGEFDASFADTARLTSVFPDVLRAKGEFARAGAFADEQLVSRLFDAPGRWLLDARNVVPLVNGTAKAAIGLSDGLYERRQGDITLWAHRPAADYHRFKRRYAQWDVAVDTPRGRFAAVLRLSQPWQISEALDLHALAPFNVFLMLDTIAWDTVYPAPAGLDAAWQYIARYADGLLFISEFSRQRFLARFEVSPHVSTGVVHLSLDPSDYVTSPAKRPADEPYWLIVGNDYDHKHVGPTLDLLTRAFPTRRFVALGDSGAVRGSRVTQLTSGPTDEAHLQSLYSGAELMVFPSFYEGFGFPLVNALACGGTVVARESALVSEIGAAYSGPGRLVTFRTDAELIDGLCRLAHGRPVPEISFAGDRSNGSAFGWGAAAGAIETFLADLIARPNPVQMRARATLASLINRS